jgi:hypothetical protein
VARLPHIADDWLRSNGGSLVQGQGSGKKEEEALAARYGEGRAEGSDTYVMWLTGTVVRGELYE